MPFLVSVVVCLFLTPLGAWAQSSESPAAALTAPSTVLAASKPVAIPLVTANSAVVSLAPLWSQLSAAQQQSLFPLATLWDSMSDGHRRKWIALSKSYSSLAPAEQTKLHSRMAEWATLKPQERELARLNFAETKKVPATDRAAHWETYKALSEEERKTLAERAPAKSKGAAAAIKPVEPGKMAIVPITRHSDDQIRQAEFAKGTIDRRTLLPIAIAPQSPASALKD